MSLTIGTVAELGLDSDLVSAFYERHWPRKIALADKTFYDWQFKFAPSSSGIDNCVVAYESTERLLVGAMGLNPRRFSLSGTWNLGAELTTWMLAEKYQGSGTGARMISYIQASYEVVIGMGVSALALPVYMRSGFRCLSAIPRFVKVLDLDAIAPISVHTPLAAKLFRKWSEVADRHSWQVSEGIGADITDLFERTRTQLNLAARDRNHLLWRYEQHPFFKYKPFMVTSPGTGSRAFVCLREETSLDGLRLMHVVDCFGDDDAIPAALSFIEAYCRDAQFHVVDFYCTAARINRFLLSDGWFSTVDDTCFQFPHLFHPLEVRKPPTTSLIYWSKANFSDMCDFSKLYITKQDADLDRPVPAG